MGKTIGELMEEMRIKARAQITKIIGQGMEMQTVDCLYFSSLKGIPGQRTAILSYIDPLVAVLVAVTILKEPLTLQQTLGGALKLGFPLWSILTENTKSSSP